MKILLIVPYTFSVIPWENLFFNQKAFKLSAANLQMKAHFINRYVHQQNKIVPWQLSVRSCCFEHAPS